MSRHSVDFEQADADEEDLRKSMQWKKGGLAESLDFDESESIVWRKHHLRRFFQEKSTWWNQSRRSTVYKWALVIYIGVVVACAGSFVVVFTLFLFELKFRVAYAMLDNDDVGTAFVSFTCISMALALVASLLCVYEPATAGAGITEVKAFLNGVNLKKFVRIQVFYCKIIGMCFSVASGLPLGKEGPMIHCGAIIGAAVSQGRTNFFGFDTSWTKYQALRNDLSKRDFVTFGAAAGIAAAFRSPIGGIMFTLEEGASFWSNTVTFRGFFCALVTVLVIQILFLDNGSNAILGMYQFGTFVEFNENQPNYHLYELAVFALVGIFGGILGAIFNHINETVLKFRARHVQTLPRKIMEVMGITFLWCMISFLLPMIWGTCTDLPTETANWTASERELLDELVQFQCPSGSYNQVASLFFCSADVAMQQLVSCHLAFAACCDNYMFFVSYVYDIPLLDLPCVFACLLAVVPFPRV
jgi:chloride channel 7